MRKVVLVMAVSLGLAAQLGGVALASDGEPSKSVTPPKPAVKTVSAVTLPKTYDVVVGDSLSTIAQNQQLPSWVPLWNANPSLNDPDLIYPGQQLTVPTGPTTPRPLPTGDVSAPVQTSSSVSYTPAATNRRSVQAANYSAETGGLFARIRQREAGGNYAENTGNGYYGAYQFSLGTWESLGGSGLPSNASPAEQDALAQKLYSERGCEPWPNTCY